MPISFEKMSVLVGGTKIAEQIREKSLFLFTAAHDYARDQGIIIADTKFEWAIIEGEVVLIDEVLTPDSSRFWPADEFVKGRGQRSFDKQFVRDWLEKESGWDKESPPPPLPPHIVTKTREKYIEAHDRITQKRFVP